MRENLLRGLARRAATDPEFLRGVRENTKATLARYGYDLTGEELRLVEELRRRTALMSDGDLARMLAGGLERRAGAPPARPAAPGRGGSRPARPARPGGGRGTKS